MKDIYAIASISSFSMEISEYPFGVNQNGNNKFKDQLLKLFQDSRSFDKCNFIVDAMYVEAIKMGAVTICDDGSISMDGYIFSRDDKYSVAAMQMLKGVIREAIEYKLYQIKASMAIMKCLHSFRHILDEIEKLLNGMSDMSVDDFIDDFKQGLSTISDDIGSDKSPNVDAFMEVLSDDNLKTYPKDLILMFMVFMLLMIIMLIEAKLKMNEHIYAAMGSSSQ